MRFDLDELTDWCRQVLLGVGMRESEASLVATSLLHADIRGVATHGLTRLPIYVERMRRGVLTVQPTITVTRLGQAAATVDGDHGPGQLAGSRAMDTAIDMARDAGSAVVTARNSAHFGAAAWYTTIAAEAGMVGIALSHAEADVVPFGGSQPALGTNPISLAVPGGPESPPLLLDMATSAAAMGKVLLARREGRELPEGWAVDEHGEPTTDPQAARAVVPLGGPKGYGLAVFVDILSSLLTGAPFGADIPRMYDDLDTPQRLGHVFLAIDISHFVPVADFRRRMGAFERQLSSTPPARGVDHVQLPGQPEHDRERVNRVRGVPLAAHIVEELEELGETSGVALPVASSRSK